MKKKILLIMLALFMCLGCIFNMSIVSNAAESASELTVYNNGATGFKLSDVLGTGSYAACGIVQNDCNYPCILAYVGNSTNISIGNVTGNYVYYINKNDTVMQEYPLSDGYAIPLYCSSGQACLFIPTASYKVVWNDFHDTFYKNMPCVPQLSLPSLNNANTSQLSSLRSFLSSRESTIGLYMTGITVYNSGGYQNMGVSSISGSCTTKSFLGGDSGSSVMNAVGLNYYYTVKGTQSGSLYVPSMGGYITVSMSVNTQIKWSGQFNTIEQFASTCCDTRKSTSRVYWLNVDQGITEKSFPVLKNKDNHSGKENITYTKLNAYQHTKIVTCEGCKTRKSSTAVNHNWNKNEVTKQPTCTEPGVRTFTCTDCGQTKTEPIKATGHKPSEAIKENETPATCISAGWYDSVVYCSVCKEEISRTKVDIQALGHDWKVVSETPATIYANGFINYKCSRCDETKQEITQKLDPMNNDDTEKVVNNIYNYYKNNYSNYGISEETINKLIEYIKNDKNISENRKIELIKHLTDSTLTKEDIEYLQKAIKELGINDDAFNKLLAYLLSILDSPVTPIPDPNTPSPTPGTEPEPEKKMEDTIGPEGKPIDSDMYDKLKQLLTDAQGLFNGKQSYEFTSDGNKFKVEYKNGKYVVSMLDDDSKWITIPENSALISKEAVYSYTVVKNPDGTISIQVLKNKTTKLKKVVIKSFKSTKKKKATVKVKKLTSITGYQIKVSTNKKFKKKYTKSKNITLKKMKKSKYKYTFKKLKSKKTYYVKARAYKVVNGKKIYGNWSKVKKVKVK